MCIFSIRHFIESFVTDVLIVGKFDSVTSFVNPKKYLQHNSSVADGLDGLGDALKAMAENNIVMVYEKVHKVLGRGNFVLTMSECLTSIILAGIATITLAG